MDPLKGKQEVMTLNNKVTLPCNFVLAVLALFASDHLHSHQRCFFISSQHLQPVDEVILKFSSDFQQLQYDNASRFCHRLIAIASPVTGFVCAPIS